MVASVRWPEPLSDTTTPGQPTAGARDLPLDVIDPNPYQARQAFENLKKVYARGGATLQDIVKLNIYLTDLAHRAAVREVRKEYLGDHNPPSTTVVVASLVDRDLLIEIDATAMVDA